MTNISAQLEDRKQNGASSTPADVGIVRSANPPVRVADPCTVVVFGASGDLAKRKLLPAFYNLAKSHLLPDQFAVVGFARAAFDQEQFRDLVRDSICLQQGAKSDFEPAVCDWVIERLTYVEGDYTDPDRYKELKETLSGWSNKWHTADNYLFYLATPPDLFLTIVRRLSACGLTSQEEGHWRRVIIEKPFGTDLRSAQNLNRELLQILKEVQIYRIDHYLGKETVQNILVFRFSNSIFEPVWNRRYVDHVQVMAAETLGVEHRGAYYDKTGALRDMVPSHMMQLISLTAMEPPTSFHADAVHDEQVKVLKSVQTFSPEDVLAHAVRGQYDEGVVEGRQVPAYRSEPMVDPHSNTETFVALKLFIDNWRWADVPFYIRTGKRLHQRVTEIVVQFRKPPLILFRDTPLQDLQPNTLVMSIQPDEAISLSFGLKVPGPQVAVKPVKMDFHYADYFDNRPTTGYERLLYDCMIGDATLFQRADMAEAGWAVVDPILDLWKVLPPRFPNYTAGTWGPSEALTLLHKDGRRWRFE